MNLVQRELSRPHLLANRFQGKLLAAMGTVGVHWLCPDQTELLRSSVAPRLGVYRSGVNLSPSRISPMSVTGAPNADPARAFLDHLPTIDRLITVIARRNGLSSTDADEFGSWARARIIDNNYAVFSKFAGRSSVSTYLSVVLTNLFHDYRNSVWGRWRPSVTASRGGPTAMRLEALLYRDNYSLREAVEVLRSSGVTLSAAEIGQIAVSLPARQSASEVPLEVLDGTPHEADGVTTEVPADADDDFAILRAAVQELAPEDQVIMRMRFWDDISVADIARALRLEQKPLYRRIEAIETRLRAVLSARGVDRERARELLSSDVVW